MPTPNGLSHVRPDGDAIAITRMFAAPVEVVWAAISESERTALWFGTFEGDPADGYVMVSMNAEGDENTAPIRYSVDRCEPPRLLQVSSSTDFGDWNLVLEVEPTTAGSSSLTLSHLVTDPSSIENVGPGWEYYLDRLAAALVGADPDTVAWEDYYPAMQSYYLAIQETLAAR